MTRVCTERCGSGRWVLLVLVLAGPSGEHQLAASTAPEHQADEASTVRAPVGGELELPCQLDFPFNHRIPYHLQWDKDGEEIYSWYSGGGGGGDSDGDGAGVEAVALAWRGRARRAGRGGGLRLLGLRAPDSGLYRCRVAFPNRSPPARRPPTLYTLIVVGDDLIAAPPANATVLEGERVELTCTPREPQLAVRWSRDGAPLDGAAGGAAGGAPLVLANGSLVLERARASDRGLYECSVGRLPTEDAPEDPASQRAAAFLDVQYPAKVVHAPSERLLPRGRPASLDCHFSANPPLTNLRWEKDGFLFDPYNVPGVFYSRNGSLLFNRVHDEHEGLYSCTPYNALGTAGAAPPVRVRVLRAPELQAPPQPLYVARLGGALTMPCEPRAMARQPPPAVRWRRADGRPLPPGRHALSGGNLTLAPLAAADAGRYECTVSNAAGAVHAAAELRLENAPPRAPRRLSARATPTSVHVTWQGPEQAAYEVWHRAAGAPEWRSLRVLSRGACSATLLSLQPDTAYELRVLLTDQLGDGLFSRPLIVHTPREEAGGVTEAFAATTDTDTDTDSDSDSDSDSDAGNGIEQEEGEGGDGGVRVQLRLVEEGVLVRWEGGGAGEGGCRLRVTADSEEIASLSTEHRYALVGGAAEGALVAARVQCGAGRWGSSSLQVPAWSRLRAVAAGCSAAGLLLVALAAAGWALHTRRRRQAR